MTATTSENSWIKELGADCVAHEVTQWEVLETHISWVVLTGTLAYKIKKPVQFEFVDYHTLEQRRHYCQLELEFNRRFCPELYLGSVPIVRIDQRILLDPAAHQMAYRPEHVIEWAVKMQQFSQSEIVGRHLLAGDQSFTQTRRLAAEFGADLAQRHAALPTLPTDRCPWYTDGVEHDSAENFHYFATIPLTKAAPAARAPLAPDGGEGLGVRGSEADTPLALAARAPLAPVGGERLGVRGSEAVALLGSNSNSIQVSKTWLDRIANLRAWSLAHLAQIRSSLEARARTGHVRQCHGDLHLQNIVMWQGRWAAFDGIEFNDRFQWIDVFSELAFTAMDLQAHGRADLRAVFLSEYLESTGEYHNLDILRFFLVYRAMVRAKIGHLKGVSCGSLHADQLSLEATSVEPCDSTPEFTNLPEWQRYLLVAQRLALGSHPQLIIMHGLSGSGKSTVARQLVAENRGLRVRSDRVRHLLPETSGASSRYAHATRDQVYDELLKIAADILQAGFTAIIDATFLQRRHRQQMAALASQLEVSFFIASCVAPVEELERRILNRTNDPSEATLLVLQQQLREQEPLGEDELACLFAGLGRAASSDMASAAVLPRSEIVDELRELAGDLQNAKRMGRLGFDRHDP
jgi:aminoglycoside phosphotransferase family enzyme/predicted kinase